MRAAVMHAFTEPLTVEEVRDPDVPPDGALIEVRATGLCRSDWHGWMGHDPAIRLPHVPGGHELAGVVAAVGSAVHGVRAGDRVTVPFCCGCGRCEPCRQGHTQVCDVDYQLGFSAWAGSPNSWRSPPPTSTASAFLTASTSTRPHRWVAAS